MSIEKGMTAKIEDWMAGLLAALQYNNVDVFKTAAAWAHQLDSRMESFGQFEPFAFVAFAPLNPQREGSYDLCENLRFEVMFGLDSVNPGVARRGDANHLGGSKIRDLVIACLEDQHPGSEFDCDNFSFAGEIEYLDAPKRYCAGLWFEAKWFSQ